MLQTFVVKFTTFICKLCNYSNQYLRKETLICKWNLLQHSVCFWLFSRNWGYLNSNWSLLEWIIIHFLSILLKKIEVGAGIRTPNQFQKLLIFWVKLLIFWVPYPLGQPARHDMTAILLLSDNALQFFVLQALKSKNLKK